MSRPVPTPVPRLVLAALLAALTAGLSACDGGAEGLTLVKPLGSFTVGPRDTVAVDLLPYVTGASTVSFSLDRTIDGLWIDGTRLVLAPRWGQRYDVTVIATGRGGASARLPFRVNETPTWAVRPPAGTLDPLPLVAGDTLRFAFREWTNPQALYTSQTVSEGTVTWAVTGLAFAADRVTVDLTETVVTTTGMLSRTRQSVVLPSTGALPALGAFVVPRGSAALPRFFALKPDGTAGYSGTIQAGFGQACFLNAHATAEGLQAYWVDCSSHRPNQSGPNSLRLDRLR